MVTKEQDKIIEKKAQIDMFSIIMSIMFILIMCSFIVILGNQRVINNNNECIRIKFSEGENNNFCSCMTKSIEWSLDKELKKGYIEVYNKFCGEYNGD